MSSLLFLIAKYALYSILSLAFLIITYVLYDAFIYPLHSKLRHIPGPKGGILRTLFSDTKLSKDRVENYQLLSKEYGPTFKIQHLFGETLISTDPKVFQTVLGQCYDFPKPQMVREGVVAILGDGLVFKEGSEHKRLRKLMNPAFTHATVKNLIPTFQKRSEELVEKWASQVGEDGSAEIEVSSDLAKSTLDIIGEAGFSFEFNTLKGGNSELAKSYDRAFNPEASSSVILALRYLVPWLPLNNLPIKSIQTFNAAQKCIERTADQIIEQKMQLKKEGKPIGNDLLAILIESRDDATGEGLSNQDIKNQVLTFVAAGHETSATALTWLLHYLTLNLDVQKRLRSEIKSVSNNGKDITFESIENMRYLNNVMREIFRLVSPVSATVRVSSKESVLGGYNVPKDTSIVVAIAGVNTNQAAWGDDANEFNPDRWDNLPSDLSSYAYLTFSGGPRICIGKKFTEVELKTILINIILNFEVRRKEGYEVVRSYGATVKVKGGLKIRMIKI